MPPSVRTAEWPRKIAIDFYSEPMHNGNCTRYYFVSKRGDKVTMSGRANAKQYLNVKSAENMAAKLREIYPSALISVV